MTREEAIKILDPKTSTKAFMEILYQHDYMAQGVVDALNLAVAALREQEQRRWIPASEPPKDSEHVLVCTKHRKPFKARYYPDRKRWDVSGSVVITHWMPLPEPPKGD